MERVASVMNKDLLSEIEAKRKELVSVGIRKGLLHKDTIKVSQQLDELINVSMKVRN